MSLFSFIKFIDSNKLIQNQFALLNLILTKTQQVVFKYSTQNQCLDIRLRELNHT